MNAKIINFPRPHMGIDRPALWIINVFNGAKDKCTCELMENHAGWWVHICASSFERAEELRLQCAQDFVWEVKHG